jgi:pyruvate kinase
VAHRQEILGHPLVDELRFNTISPRAEPIPDLLARLRGECAGKRLWIDLKGRQLRIARFAFLPYAHVELNHRIRVRVPTEIWLFDGVARVEAVVDGCRLILSGRPFRVLGEGEPVNILDPTLEVLDPLPRRDVEFIEAARRLGMHDYMLSFVESEEDLRRVRDLDPQARVVAKIESLPGLDFVRTRPRRVRLMAARDDLFIQMGRDKTGILEALRLIIRADPQAIAASRLLESLQEGEALRLADLSDLALLEHLGYRTFMLGDGICFRQECFQRAMQVWERYFRR